MKIGYARTSTIDQVAGLEAQLRDLQAAGCEKIYQEQISSVAPREELKKAIEYAKEGDVLIVMKTDRLARSTAHLLEIVQTLEKKKVGLQILDNASMDTTSPTGKAFLTVLSAIAKLEREIMLERQREGIAKAKAEGKFKGRKPMSKALINEILQKSKERITRKDLAKYIGISEATVYRVLKKGTRILPESNELMSCGNAN